MHVKTHLISHLFSCLASPHSELIQYPIWLILWDSRANSPRPLGLRGKGEIILAFQDLHHLCFGSSPAPCSGEARCWVGVGL